MGDIYAQDQIEIRKAGDAKIIEAYDAGDQIKSSPDVTEIKAINGNLYSYEAPDIRVLTITKGENGATFSLNTDVMGNMHGGAKIRKQAWSVKVDNFGNPLQIQTMVGTGMRSVGLDDKNIEEVRAYFNSHLPHIANDPQIKRLAVKADEYGVALDPRALDKSSLDGLIRNFVQPSKELAQNL